MATPRKDKRKKRKMVMCKCLWTPTRVGNYQYYKRIPADNCPVVHTNAYS